MLVLSLNFSKKLNFLFFSYHVSFYYLFNYFIKRNYFFWKKNNLLVNFYFNTPNVSFKFLKISKSIFYFSQALYLNCIKVYQNFLINNHAINLNSIFCFKILYYKNFYFQIFTLIDLLHRFNLFKFSLIFNYNSKKLFKSGESNCTNSWLLLL